jgi:YjbR
VTPNDFRRIALSMPDVVEGSHMGHRDFRAGGRIFATLGYPDARLAMVKLTPEQQAKLVETKPEVFTPVPGGWGRSGSTRVLLSAADKSTRSIDIEGPPSQPNLGNGYVLV